MLIELKVGCTLLDYCSECTEIQLRYIQVAQYTLSFKPDTTISATSAPSDTSSHFSSLHETYEDAGSYTLQWLLPGRCSPISAQCAMLRTVCMKYLHTTVIA